VVYTPPKSSFIERLELAFEAYADRPCVKFGNHAYSYAEVNKLSRYIATDLSDKGFEKGDFGAVYSENSARVLIVVLGILRAGGVWIPVNPRNTESENERVLSTLCCKTIFYQKRFFQAVKRVKQELAGELICVDIDQPNYSADSVPDVDAPEIEFALTDLVSLPFTGGTTGTPKGVLLSNANFNAISYGVSRWYKDYDSQPISLCVAPMTHVGGRVALAAMISGACLLVHQSFDTRAVLRTIQEERAMDVFLPPTAIYSMLEEPALAEFDHSSLRTILYGSAPISLEKLKQALRVFGPVMRSAYGHSNEKCVRSNRMPNVHCRVNT